MRMNKQGNALAQQVMSVTETQEDKASGFLSNSDKTTTTTTTTNMGAVLSAGGALKVDFDRRLADAAGGRSLRPLHRPQRRRRHQSRPRQERRQDRDYGNVDEWDHPDVLRSGNLCRERCLQQPQRRLRRSDDRCRRRRHAAARQHRSPADRAPQSIAGARHYALNQCRRARQ